MRRSIVSMLAVSLLAAAVPAHASSDRVGRYIVVLDDSVRRPGEVAQEHSRGNGARIGYVYTDALKGYSATMSDVAAARLASDDRVAYVEADGAVSKTVTQDPATWGLSRIDQRALPAGTSYTYNATGAGVTAYIIDSGITPTPAEFGSRVTSGLDTIDGGSTADCDGHGTHVAGTVGSATYGVAKEVSLVGVRVLDCNGSGTWSGVIAGIDWVTTHHVSGAPAVANMSLGGGASSSVDQAVANSIADGVTYAVAAGNGNKAGQAQDACNYSPARAPNALTVGATNSTDTKASWSNYGACVDLFAPGVSITSTTMDGRTATWSGTSMASPHVAGVAALYLQSAPTALPAEVGSTITGQATPNAVLSPGTGSPNLLLFALLTTAGSTPVNAAPTIAIGSPAPGSTVSGSVTVDVTASDSDGSVQEVAFFVNGATVPFATDISATDGWSALWDSTTVGDGSQTIRAVATDDLGATATASVSVTVDNIANPPASPITLDAVGYKVKGVQKVDLTWAGATSPNVELFRNTVSIGSTLNDGAQTDSMGKGGGTFTYQVCETGDATRCSNEATVVF